MLALASAIGGAAFLSPFWLARAQTTGADRTAHGGDAPLVFAAIGILCLVVLLIEAGGGADPDAKRVALLGVLVAANAAARLVPDILGANPIYFLPICVGFVWGPSFGFLLGAASLAISALITGGIGPWVPFQMLTLGWVGMTAGLLGGVVRSSRFGVRDSGRSVPQTVSSANREPRLPRTANPELRTSHLILLAMFALLWGFLYGAIMNLWFWPFAAPSSPAESGLYWTPGLGLGETARRYAAFYLTTSGVYDAFRAVGNVAMVAVFGRPVVLLLLRFRDRFTWQPLTYLPDAAPRDGATKVTPDSL